MKRLGALLLEIFSTKLMTNEDIFRPLWYNRGEIKGIKKFERGKESERFKLHDRM